MPGEGWISDESSFYGECDRQQHPMSMRMPSYYLAFLRLYVTSK